MNVSIYLENSLSKQLNHFIQTTGLSRNQIIRTAVKEWIFNHSCQQQWPESIKQFQGCLDLVPFEATRKELLSPKEDPLS